MVEQNQPAEALFRAALRNADRLEPDSLVSMIKWLNGCSGPRWDRPTTANDLMSGDWYHAPAEIAAALPDGYIGLVAPRPGFVGYVPLSELTGNDTVLTMRDRGLLMGDKPTGKLVAVSREKKAEVIVNMTRPSSTPATMMSPCRCWPG